MTVRIEYTHSYAYRRSLGPAIWFPLLTVELIYGREPPIRVDALLDTGAEYSVFDAEIADTFNLTLTQKTPLAGIGGSVSCYKHKLFLRFEPLTQFVDCEVLFMQNMNKSNLPNLIGRIPVFEHLQVGFDEYRKAVYMALVS